VEFGKEALKFENGAFSYFGVPSIMPAGTNTQIHKYTQIHTVYTPTFPSHFTGIQDCKIFIIIN